MPQWHLAHGESYLVTGEPVIVSDLTSSISHSIELLLIAVAAGDGRVARARLLRAPAPAAAGARAARRRAHLRSAVALVGASLTMASIAVLPVLVGLAVDYAIQFQARVQEEAERRRRRGRAARRPARRSRTRRRWSRARRAPARRRSRRPPRPARPRCSCCCSRPCRWCAASACCWSWASRSRCCARSAWGRPRSRCRRPRPRLAHLAWRAGSPHASLAPAWRGARELVARQPAHASHQQRRARRRGAPPRARARRRGWRSRSLGWGLDTQTKVQTDITKLVPQSLGFAAEPQHARAASRAWAAKSS